MDTIGIGTKVTHGDSGLVGTVAGLSEDGKTALVQTHGTEETVPVAKLREPSVE